MIVAIDPGGATGIAFLGERGAFETRTVDGGFDGMSDFLVWLGLGNVDAVVIENFVPRGGALSTQLDALHIIGAVKHECRQRGIPLILQTPTQAKSFATNDKLKAVGWYTVGADHERDAARHMLVYVAKGAGYWGLTPYAAERDRVLAALAAL